MVIDPGTLDHIYLAAGYTFLRRGIDGLASIIQEEFDLNPFENSLFCFAEEEQIA